MYLWDICQDMINSQQRGPFEVLGYIKRHTWGNPVGFNFRIRVDLVGLNLEGTEQPSAVVLYKDTVEGNAPYNAPVHFTAVNGETEILKHWCPSMEDLMASDWDYA